jgi:Tol biopolymer transport system component
VRSRRTASRSASHTALGAAFSVALAGALVACARPPAARPFAPDAPTGEPVAAERVADGALAAGASAYNPSLAPDGRTLVFARSAPGFRHPVIHVARLHGDARRGRWAPPVPVPWADPRWGDTDPTLTPDGRTLYFASDRPAPGRDSTRRDLDLWRVRRADRGGRAGSDRWGVLEHLGPAVNTRNQELGPTWRDGVLYFASARRAGVGGLDLYAAHEVNGQFGAAALFGGALNTAASEGDPEFSPDGRTLVFWSDRAGGRGSADLWASRRAADGSWSPPVPLRGAANSPWFDFTPSFSPDGRWLYFASERPARTPTAAPPTAGPSRAPGAATDGEGAADVWRIPTASVLP